MPGGTGIPGPGVPIFPRRTLLQEDVPFLVENQHVDRSMEQVIPMHFVSRGRAHDPILLVDDREVFRIGRTGWGERNWPDIIGERDPFFEGELFGSHLWVEAKGIGGRLPV